MKFKIKDQDLVDRNLEEAFKCLPLELRLAGMKPEEMLKVFKPEEELKRLKEILDNLNLN